MCPPGPNNCFWALFGCHKPAHLIVNMSLKQVNMGLIVYYFVEYVISDLYVQDSFVSKIIPK